MQKNRGHPLLMNDFDVTIKCDLSLPLTITYQLFWFSDAVTKYLKKSTFFKSSNGIVIGALDDLTYERTKMEGTERVYLLGFGSNKSSNCFKELRLVCLSEDEKLTTHRQIISAIHELIDNVHNNKNGSSFIEWPI